MLTTSDLIASCQTDWEAYTRHRFVQELGSGTLPEAAFRHYLQQDYLFLTHFARAYALAIYKCDNFADMRYPAYLSAGNAGYRNHSTYQFLQKMGSDGSRYDGYS